MPTALKAAWVSLALIAAQIVAGAVTIVRQNDAPSVAAHLVLGFATFVSLLMVTLIAYMQPMREQRSSKRNPVAWIALAATLTVLAAVFAGGWMAASNDGLACTAIPLCGATGALTADQQIHMTHRFAAYVAVVAVIVTWLAAIATRRNEGPLLIAAWGGFALVLLQGALGVAAVASRLQPAIRSVHEANAALLLASLVATTYLAFRSPAATG